MKYYYQLKYLIYAILSIPVFPILYIMAIHAKRKTGKLPDAEVPSGKIDGNSEMIRLATIGESTVAGVGVLNHKDGVTFQIAKLLHEKTNHNIIWDAVGGTGYNVDKVRKQLVNKLPNGQASPQFIVIMLGGNDTFELRSPLTWRRGMSKLIMILKERYPNAKIVIANLPPVKDFTSFNMLLQWYLGGLNNMHRKVILDFPTKFSDVLYMSEEIDFDSWMKKEGKEIPMKDFFSDGVHPSALTYRLWGEQIGEKIIELK